MLNIKSISEFLSRLNKRDRFIFYIVAVFLSMVLFERLMINPIYSKIKSFNEEINKREARINKSLRILAQKDKISAESQEYSSFVTKGVSEEEEFTSFLRDVEDLANKNSVYLVDLKPGGAKEVGSAKKYIVLLNCEAQMEQIVNFMFNIENSDKLLTIEKYQINPKSKESTVAQCNMAISKIVMP
jgi:Tfp pilus assembly protein PilO